VCVCALLYIYETNILGGELLLLIIRKSCIKMCEMEIVCFIYFW